IECSIGVSVEPGATTLQRIPYRATSSPRHLVNATAAALDAAYADIAHRAVPAALDATVTTLPRERGTIRLTTARDISKTPVALTARHAAQSSSVSDRASPRRSTPALFTRWSTGPSRRSTAATTDSTSDALVTSHWNASTRTPSAPSFCT